MKSLLVLICVFAFSLALEYNFEVPPLRLSSLIKLEKRHSPSSQHQQHGRSAEQGKDVDNVQAYQDERKLPKDNLDDMAPAWSTQGNSQTCYYDMNATVIIKTNRSLTAGAKFVKFVQAENSLECARQCCDTPACNQAIFENKVNKYIFIYVFDHHILRFLYSVINIRFLFFKFYSFIYKMAMTFFKKSLGLVFLCFFFLLAN